MRDDDRTITFQERDFKGSRYRCLLATHMPRPKVLEFLNSLVQPHAAVINDDFFSPQGFCHPKEPKIEKEPRLLGDDAIREALVNWWLADRSGNPTTPNWDIASRCLVDGKRGILLVEAKAHEDELKHGPACGAQGKNRDSIEKALAEAAAALGTGWSLSTAEPHYQMCNRFAWGWKLAQLKIPVVLVYLGFLGAREMDKGYFGCDAAWQECLHSHADGCVPPGAWGTTIQVNGTPFTALIHSADVNMVVDGAGVMA